MRRRYFFIALLFFAAAGGAQISAQNPAFLVSPESLAQHLADSNLVVLEVDDAMDGLVVTRTIRQQGIFPARNTSR